MQTSPVRQLLVLVILAMGATLAPVSIDVLAPSLPGISTDLGASPRTVELTIYAFLVGYGVAPSFWGPLSDRIGRRPVMFTGMAIYIGSTLAAALAHDPHWLIAARVLQGVGGGAGATMARAIIRDIYGAAGATRGMAQMISIMALLPIAMPLLGGTMASLFNWRACFAAMASIAVISVVAYFHLVPESAADQREAGDSYSGALLRILRHPVFAQHTLCNMFSICALVLFGANYAFISRDLFGFDPGANGVVLALFNGSIAAGTYLVWWLMRRYATHGSILLGALACTLGWLGIALLAACELASPAMIAPWLMCAGAGSGIIMSLCPGSALTPFSRHTGAASSLYLLVQSLGSCVVSLAVGQFLPQELLPIALATAACGALALLTKGVLFREARLAANH